MFVRYYNAVIDEDNEEFDLDASLEALPIYAYEDKSNDMLKIYTIIKAELEKGYEPHIILGRDECFVCDAVITVPKTSCEIIYINFFVTGVYL